MQLLPDGDILKRKPTKPGNKEFNKVVLSLMSPEECAKSKYEPGRTTKNMFCGGFMEGGKDSCKVSWLFWCKN